ncbi:MAG: 2-phospho-L-lactate guanylyltransferase, partial [Deltaproteobacteria bacterium]
MLSDMIAALGRCRALDRTVVVSADPTLLAEAERLGADTIDEGRPRGLNQAVEMAAGLLERRGVSRLLTIPGDVPLIEPGEVEALLATDPRRHPVVLVPSAAGTGTNALLASPPTIIRPCFEGHSLEAYQRTCRAAGIESLVLPLAGFALDVDTIEDLECLARSGN